MECITSRDRDLPISAAGMEKGCPPYNLWKIRMWPYKELLPGDIIYFYERPSQSIVWKTRVMDVERFYYPNKKYIVRRLEKKFRKKVDTTHKYYKKKDPQGYCLAYKVKAIKKVYLPKPDNYGFRRDGWLRVNEDIERDWLKRDKMIDEQILDEYIRKGTLLEQLYQLNKAMAEISPERVHRIAKTTIYKDTEFIKILKKLCGYACQFPGCNVKIPKRKKGFYIEACHIKPKRKGGKSLIGNLLVLCPNHHKEFDYGDLKILEQSIEYIRGRLNGKDFEIYFPR